MISHLPLLLLGSVAGALILDGNECLHAARR